jgi:Leucine-rich repeat (LRR) protein
MLDEIVLKILVKPISEMTRMTNLYMSENRNLADLTPLSNMPDLFYLSFKQTSVSNIDALRNAVNMDTLVLSQTGVRDISVVDRMTKLTYLDIRDCPIKDYGPAKRFDARDNSKLEK